MKHRHLRVISLILFLVLLFCATASYSVDALSMQRTIAKVHPLLIEHLYGHEKERLRTDGDMISVFVTLTPGYGLQTVNDIVTARYAFGPQGAPSMIYGNVKTDALIALASRTGVTFIYPDVQLQYQRAKPDPDVYREGLALDMGRVREIIGAGRVNQLGISGEDVTIAITDTGTDFTIPDLVDAIARDQSGSAVSFDADGQGYTITELVVERESNVLKTGGKTVDVWDPSILSSGSWPPVEKVTMNVDYGAPTVQSKSGKYHFGILRQVIEDIVAGELVSIDFSLVVVDTNTPNVYDTVVVDMSTALHNFLTKYGSKLNSEAFQDLDIGLKWPTPQASWNDHSFADEQPHTASPQNDVISLDVTADGVPDFSAGILAHGIDVSGRTGRYYSLLPPIDPAGNFVNVYYDFDSHGTSTASNAASRGTMSRNIYKNGTMLTLPGIAPKAKVMGIKALWFGDIVFGWYYAAGFDWDPANFVFKYTGKHRADLISNSWGVPNTIFAYGSTFGADALSQLANALSLPRYLDPAYPGIVILVAAGNYGFGYGTVSSAGSATLAITVGASTSYHYRGAHPSFKVTGREIQGGYDEIIPWSSRGPTSLGEPKPDVVNVGAFGFTDQMTYTGYGDGTKAYDVFGGTSMSTPVTAGAVALVIEEYRKTHNGLSPAPDVVKSILASAATDLSYDVFTQGSGRVNAFDAVAAAAEGKDSNFPRRFYVSSPSAWDVARKFVAGSWAINFQTLVPQTPMTAAKWFAGIVSPRTSVETTLTLHNAGSGTQAQAFVMKLIDVQRYPSTTPGSGSDFEKWITLSKLDFPSNADLMKVTLIYRFSDFADTQKWDLKDIILPYLYDTNVDSSGGIRRITSGIAFGTTNELTVSHPVGKFQGIPKVRILNFGLGSGGPEGVPIELIVRFYQRVSWDWVRSINVSADSVNVDLAVPANAQPGVYDGLIMLTDGPAKTVVPVSVIVPIVTSDEYGGAASDTPYDNYAVYGAFDWGESYASGDWRVFAVVVQQATTKLTFEISWSESRTDIDAHLTGPRGYLLASSEYPHSHYLGSGTFLWRTSTGGPANELTVMNPQPGVYLLVLHNVLLGASSFDAYPEPFTLNVRFE